MNTLSYNKAYQHKAPWLHILYLLVIAGCVLIYLKNYWLAEDSYINFRSLDQLWVGRGPVWNPDERVQVYTSALWYWLIASMKFFVRDNYLVTFLCSFALYLFSLDKIARLQSGYLATFTAIALLLSCNSFMDFTASGLENVLIYYLLLLFFDVSICSHRKGDLRPYFLAALLLTARHDMAVLILPVCCSIAFKDWRENGWRKVLALMLVGGLPFFVWEIFSLIYYGFPFPNTAYAKLSSGISQAELTEQGLNYLYESGGHDPLLLVVGVTGVAAGFFSPRLRWVSVGILLDVAYIIHIGGDYMRGRFFSYAYLLSVVVLTDCISSMHRRQAIAVFLAILCALVPYHATRPFTPVTSTMEFSDHIKELETADERGVFYHSTSLIAYFSSMVSRSVFPDWPFYTDGLKLKKELHEPWIMLTNIGMSGCAIGLDVHIFDRLALADPLLARLPSSQGSWTPGHFVRELPWGYPDANLYGNKPIYDPDLDHYYSLLRLITRSPNLFSAERWKAIVQMNLFPPNNLLRTHIEGWKLRTCQTCK